MKLNSAKESVREDRSIVYSFPFFFVVPFGTEGLDDSKPLICRILPPTYRPKALDLDSISITYKLYAHVHYRKEQDTGSEVQQTVNKIEKDQIVDYLPYSNVEPPIHVASFPEEFLLKTISPMWKFAFFGRLGNLIMSTHEPLPLAYSLSEDRPSTDLVLSLTAHAPLGAQPNLRAMSLNAKSAIRVKTFYASEQMPCLPTQTFLDRNASIRLHDEIIKLNQTDLTQLDWVWGPHFEGNEPPRYEDAVMDDGLERTSINPNTRDNSGYEWRASVRIPIHPHKTMLPTFCGSLISRSYSLILRLRVAGVRTRKADFEIPLQVVYLRPFQVRHDSILDERSNSCIGPEGLLAQQVVRFNLDVSESTHMYRNSLPTTGDRGKAVLYDNMPFKSL